MTNKILNKKQQNLLKDNYSLVSKVVNSMRSKLPSHADIDELHSVGVSGLVNAVTKFDSDRNNTFGTYASLRVRGAILDELRKMDYMSRSARTEAKNIEKIKSSLEAKLKRAPTENEVKEVLGLSEKKYSKVKARTENILFISLNETVSSEENSLNLEEIIPDESSPNGFKTLQSLELTQSLKSNMSLLTDNQKIVIEQYYFQGKKLCDIAKTLNLTEARICQIHLGALKILREKFKKN